MSSPVPATAKVTGGEVALVSSPPATKPIPGATTKPSEVPREAGGGSNAAGTGNTQGKDGNGAQKRKQEKRT